MVVIPTFPGASDTAELALTAEGVTFETRFCDGDVGYGELLAELWARDDDLVTVEHDIAPWPGAVAQLLDCPRDWCMFHYPKFGGMLTRGLGCTKFSGRLTRAYPALPEAWLGVGWQVLDGAVGAAVAEVLRAEKPERHPLCYHEPPVAHARRMGD